MKIFHKFRQRLHSSTLYCVKGVTWEGRGFRATVRSGAGPGPWRHRGGARGARPRVWYTCATASLQGDPRFTKQVLRVAPLTSQSQLSDPFTSAWFYRIYGLLQSRLTGIRTRISSRTLCSVEFMTESCGRQHSSFITYCLSLGDWQDESICVKREIS